jgi:hypothetical protein
VYWAKVTQQLTLSRRYFQLVANRCCRLACSLLETPFVTRDVFCSENVFVMRGVREPRFHCIVKLDHNINSTRQDRWIQKELALTAAKNATTPNPFKIIPLQSTRKENSWETEETLARVDVTLETERAKWPNPWCLLLLLLLLLLSDNSKALL